MNLLASDSIAGNGRKLKIVQVFNRYLQPGGEEKSVHRIACDLEAAGHTVTRFWTSSEDWVGPNRPSKLKQPFLLWNNPAVLARLREVHLREKPSFWILHNVLPVISLDVYRLANELHVPIVQWLHNYRPISVSGTLVAGGRLLDPKDPWINWKETFAGTWHGRLLTGWLALGYARIKRRGDFSSVRAWVTVSDEVRNIFREAGWPADRLFTLRHSWHIEPATATPIDDGYFLFLGRMVETKGVRFLVELWNDPLLRNTRLVMAGQGPLLNELKQNSPPNVEWIGHVEGEEKRRMVAGCRAILFPAIWPEPLSTVAYEGYQLCKPILASNLGGMKEIVQDGSTGRLLQPCNRVAWLNAILSLDTQESRRLGVNGRQWLENSVSVERWNQQFDVIVDRVLGLHGQRS